MTVAPERSTLGLCPLCGSRLPSEQLVVSYTPEEGWPLMLAECDACEEVVGPV